MNLTTLVFAIISMTMANTANAQTKNTKQQPEPESSIYIKCPSPNEPDGLNDIYINPKEKTLTDSFGTIKPYREDGPMLIADGYVDADGQRILATTLRVNRYTMQFTWMSYILKSSRSGQCTKVEKSF